MVSASTLLKFIIGVKDIVINRWECTNVSPGLSISQPHVWLRSLARRLPHEFMRIDCETVGRCISRAREYLEPDPRRRLDGLRAIGVGETSYRKGHKYITVVVSHDTNEIIWARERQWLPQYTEYD